MSQHYDEIFVISYLLHQAKRFICYFVYYLMIYLDLMIYDIFQIPRSSQGCQTTTPSHLTLLAVSRWSGRRCCGRQTVLVTYARRALRRVVTLPNWAGSSRPGVDGGFSLATPSCATGSHRSDFILVSVNRLLFSLI